MRGVPAIKVLTRFFAIGLVVSLILVDCCGELRSQLEAQGFHVDGHEWFAVVLDLSSPERVYGFVFVSLVLLFQGCEQVFVVLLASVFSAGSVFSAFPEFELEVARECVVCMYLCFCLYLWDGVDELYLCDGVDEQCDFGH